MRAAQALLPGARRVLRAVAAAAAAGRQTGGGGRRAEGVDRRGVGERRPRAGLGTPGACCHT